MSVLADSLGHSRSRITHTVQRLAGRGLVERTTCQTDGRGVVCVMTSKGWELLVAAAPIHVESVRARIIDVLTAEELSALAVAMGKIAANVASCADHGGANAKLEA